MVGIDVVDINWSGDTAGSPAYQHRGYLNRIGSASERRWVLNSPRPDEALWQLWAAKEATYKALAPNDGAPAFRPADIAVEWRSRGPANSGKAYWRDGRTHVVARAEGTCAYATALQSNKPLAVEHGVFRIDEVLGRPRSGEASPAEQSDAARRAAVFLLNLIGIKNAEVVREAGRRPYVADEPGVSVSWSHDGEWVGAIVAVHGGTR